MLYTEGYAAFFIAAPDPQLSVIAKLRREVSYGAFERWMNLPEGTVTDKVKASLKNGVIEITVPLAKETVAQKVPIEAEAERKGRDF